MVTTAHQRRHQSSSSGASLSHPGGRLVILGSGWGGFNVLRYVNTKPYETLVISPRNHFVLTPLLASSSVGTLDFRSITEPIRGLRKNAEYYDASVLSIDTKTKQLFCQSALEDNQDKFTLPYDKLVIAVGAMSNTFGLPGVAEHCMFLKSTTDARKIRQRIIEIFEHAEQPSTSIEEKRNLLHFVIVGGGPTGVEFAAELSDFMHQDLRRLYPLLRQYVSITIVEAGGHILNSFDASLQAYAEDKYRRNGIQVKTGLAVKKVEHRQFTLSDGTVLKFGLALWSTGNTSNPLISSLTDVKKDRTGRIVTDEYLRATGAPGVYALGDCATIEGMDLPATAQVAQQKAKWLAKHLSRTATQSIDPSLPSFKYSYRGSMAYIGDYQAVMDAPISKERGLAAWLAWRSFYLTNAVTWRNKMLIPMHWFLTFFFGRDTSRF